jgi:hypothetical protein
MTDAVVVSLGSAKINFGLNEVLGGSWQRGCPISSTGLPQSEITVDLLKELTFLHQMVLQSATKVSGSSSIHHDGSERAHLNAGWNEWSRYRLRRFLLGHFDYGIETDVGFREIWKAKYSCLELKLTFVITV